MDEEPPIELRAEDARIVTATVSIQTMKVGRKQVTQSLFKQLPEEELFNKETCELNADAIWGWVSYRWGGMPERTKQFVIQKGARLFRCPFVPCRSSNFEWRFRRDADSDDYPWPFFDLKNDVERVLQALHWKAALKAEECIRVATYRVRPFSQFEIGIRSSDGKVRETYWWETAQYQIEEAQRQIRIGDRTLESWTPEELEREKDRLSGQAVAYCQDWDALMDRLDAVEQLFIAC